MKKVAYEIADIIDKNQTRIHAALVCLVMIIYMLSGSLMPIYMLIYDFIARIYMTSLLSPLYHLSKGIVNLFKLEQKFTDESAKEFASHIGLTMLFIALFAELLNQTFLALTLITCLSIWKIVEATKDICFACKFYELLKRKNIMVVSL